MTIIQFYIQIKIRTKNKTIIYRQRWNFPCLPSSWCRGHWDRSRPCHTSWRWRSTSCFRTFASGRRQKCCGVIWSSLDWVSVFLVAFVEKDWTEIVRENSFYMSAKFVANETWKRQRERERRRVQDMSENVWEQYRVSNSERKRERDKKEVDNDIETAENGLRVDVGGLRKIDKMREQREINREHNDW